MIVAMNSPSCSDDSSETTGTTASTVSNGDNVHDKHVWRASLSALESKIMRVVSENARLRSELKRQASNSAKTIADLTERLERLEQDKAAEPTGDPMLEARVRSLERIVINKQAPRSLSRGRTPHNLHSSLPDLSSHGSSSIASAATRTRSRSRTRAMSNRVANAKAVSDALSQDENNNNENGEEDVSMSFGLDFMVDDSDEKQQQEVGNCDNEFPILFSPLRSSKKLSTFLSSEKDQQETTGRTDNKSVSGQSVASRRRAAREAEAPATPMKRLAPLALSPVKSQKPVLTEDKARERGELPVLSPPASLIKLKVDMPKGKMRELCHPFTPEQLARAQAEDKDLANQLTNGGMYPNFLMSVQSVNDNYNMYLFRKCIYVPESLRQPTMEYYYRQAGGECWGSTMCRHKIWPAIDADMTNFRHSETS